MKNRITFLLLLLAFPVLGQDKMLTTENCVFAARDGISPQKLQLSWIKGTEMYYYTDPADATQTLFMASASEKGDAKKVINLAELNALLAKSNVKDAEALQKFPAISWIDAGAFSFVSGNSVFTYTLSGNKLDAKARASFFEKAENADTASSGNLAFTVENNLWVYNPTQTGSSAVRAITTDKDINIVNGHSVHREEFGISKGTFWSPSGSLLAFYRMDQTMVTDYPILDLTKQPAEVKMIKYPMAGSSSHQVTVGVYNVATQKVIFLNTGEPKDQYLTNIAWSPDNQFVYIAVLNREQNHLLLNRYNATTGAFDKTVLEESNPKYVHPMHAMEFVPGHPDEFLWQSERFTASNPEGANSLYLYSTDGKLLKEIIPVDNVVTSLYGCDAKGTTVYFQAAPLGSCDRRIYSFNLEDKNTGLNKLAFTPGTNTASFSPDKKYFINMYSSPAVPCIQSLNEANGNAVKVLLTAKNPLADYKKCTVKLFTITAADKQTSLWCRMFLPADFDSTKKYRTLTYVYNGPNVQLVTNSWLGGADPFLYYMAQQGFIVFTVDGRGSDNRGLKFEQATFQHLGTQEIADQEKGAQYLKGLKYVDANRMAVYGWSFGGFMTTSLMTRKPDLFKCGVAGGPVIDWSYYEVMYTERYMDTPQSNPDGYKEASLLNYAGNLKGKLMQIHGTSDDVVVWQHSLLFQKACIDNGKQCDYYVYPGHLHNVKGKDRINLLTKISEYIITNT